MPYSSKYSPTFGVDQINDFCKARTLRLWEDVTLTNWNRKEVPKIDSKLFVPAKLAFSEYLRCLNFPLWILWPAKTKQV